MITSPELSVSGLFLEFSRSKLVEEYWPRLHGCVESLTEEQAWLGETCRTHQRSSREGT